MKNHKIIRILYALISKYLTLSSLNYLGTIGIFSFMALILQIVSGIILVMIYTPTMGYILPWGQMSLWGATVITNLASTIPIVGDIIVLWLWAGFSVANPTLNKFFSLHYLLPFIILALVMIQILDKYPSAIDLIFTHLKRLFSSRIAEIHDALTEIKGNLTIYLDLLLVISPRFVGFMVLIQLIELFKLINHNQIQKLVVYRDRYYTWVYNKFPNWMYIYFNIGRFIRYHLDPIIDTPLFAFCVGLYLCLLPLSFGINISISGSLALLSFYTFLLQNGITQSIILSDPAKRLAYENRLQSDFLHQKGAIRRYGFKTVISTLTVHFPLIPPAGYRALGKVGIIGASVGAGAYVAGEAVKAHTTIKVAQFEHDLEVKQSEHQRDVALAQMASTERIKMAELANNKKPAFPWPFK